MRRHLAWPIALPLAVVGTLAGHSLGYLAAVPNAQARASLLASSGHGYLDYLPLFVGLSSAAVLLAFCAAALAAFHGRAGSRAAQIELVAAVPPLAFVAQEFLERYLHDGRVHWELLLSAPFLLGLAVQLPFALLVAAIAFALTQVAERLGAALASRRRRPTAAPLFDQAPQQVDLPRHSALSRGYAGRGPPLVLA